jgi:altronate hydrolase
MAPTPVIRLHPDDGVLIARSSLPPGMVVADGVTTTERIPAGHKVAIKPIATGEAIRRYGQIIGFATQPIAPGQHVHTQNCGMGDFDKDYAYGVDVKPAPNFDLPAFFDGIRRPDGRVATRNYIGILTSVNCSAHVAGLVADIFKKNPFTGDNPLADFPNVDGVVALTHKTGCGMTQDEPLALLRRTLGGFARHANFSAVIVLGLGCEVNQIGGLMQEQKLAGRLRAMDIQEVGGTRKTVEAGIAFVKEALIDANKVQREPVPASELTVALQCGGSDGYSGVSANPALGAASDLLVRHGGTVILSETPETYGAEHLLTRRAVSREVGEKLVGLMRWWEDYTKREGAEMNANPSPGNKAGGLTTILEKSLGAMAKAGSTNLVDVLHYAEPVTKKGFVFMDTPGYDPSRRPGRWPAAPIWCASPPAAAACSAASPHRRSSLRPTRPCTSAWKTTWTSIAAPSSKARRRCRNAASASSTSCSRPRRASRPKARVSISAAPSSRPGCSAPRCEVARRLGAWFWPGCRIASSARDLSQQDRSPLLTSPLNCFRLKTTV